MAAKKCLICSESFSGRKDAKTCSVRCRKRLQLLKVSFGISPAKKQLAKTLLFLFIGVFSILSIILGMKPAPTSAATSSYLNFQARLLTSSGNVVADGNYNVEFKIYDASSSSGAGQGTCAGDSHCLWVETRTSTDKVRVVNGYLTVNLGSVNAFGSINWDQQLYLTMNIGGTGSPGWDGEMSPRVKLTALPYAFNAGAVAKTDGSGNRGTLSFNSVATNPNILLPDASGTVCLQTSSSCGFLTNTTGVQLQASSPGSQQTGHLNISGTGIFGTSLLTPSIDQATAGALGIANSTATAVNIGKAGSNITTTVTGLAVFKPSTGNDSATAFQVQNAAGTTSLLTADTSGLKLQVGSSTTDANAVLLVLDSYNTTDPAGVNGAQYYNTSLNKFRCYQNGAWADCITAGGSGVTTVGAFSGSSQANGASISSNTITFGPADGTNPGMVSTGTQTFAGAKTFTGTVLVSPGSSTSAFQVQGASSVLLNADTTNSKIEVTGDIYSKGLKWTSQTNPVDNSWRAVTYGNGMFVAISTDGTGNRVMTSPDGVNWTIRNSAADNTWISVTYGNGLFVATAITGTGNRVMTSPDGINWTIRNSAADNNWDSVTYGNGLFVATAITGTGNRVMTSPDGINWTIRNSAADNTWSSVTYGNGLFVAVSSNTGSTTNRVMTSPDGINWTPHNAAADNFWSSVVYGNGLFVAVAATGTNLVMTSPDGINWTSRTEAASNGWISITYGNGLFVAVANSGTGNRVMTSPDGINWTSRTSAANNVWDGVTYGNGMFVAVSNSGTGNRVMTSGKTELTITPPNNTYQGGMTVYGSSTFKSDANSTTAFQIQNSSGTNLLTADTSNMKVEVTGDIYSKGLKWTSRTLPTTGQTWWSVAYGNGLFVSVASNGTNRIITSPDGINWTSRADPTAGNSGWRSVTYGNGLFVAVANSGTNRVMTSPDGVNWTVRNAAAANSWQSVTYGNGLFVAVSTDGTNRVMTSPDGVNWTVRNAAAANSWQSVTYGNGRFVAVTDSGANKVMYSSDGITWSSSASAINTNQWWGVTYGNGLFVAVSHNTGSTANRVMTSVDGSTWTGRTAVVDNPWSAVTYGNGLFVAVNDNSGTGNRVMTSPDGINWTSRTSAADNDWTSIVYGNGMFVVAGNSASSDGVMTSGQPETSTVSNNNIYQGGMTVYGDTLHKSDANSTTAFQIQNAAGAQLFSVDTSTTQNLLSANPSVEVDTTGWAAKNGSGTSTLTRVTSTTTSPYSGNASLQIATTGANSTNAGATYNVSLSGTTTYALSFYVKASGSTNLSTLEIGRSEDGSTDTSCATAQTANPSNWTRLTCTFTTGDAPSGTTYVYIKQTDSTNHTFFVDGVQLEPKTNLLTNPGAESAISGNWTALTNSTATRSTTAGHFNSGVAGVDVAPSSGSQTNVGIKNNVALSTNTTYTFSVYAKAVGSNFSTFQIGRSEDGSTNTACNNALSVVTGGFTQYTCTFTTGTVSGTTYVYVRATDSSNRTYYVDSTQLFTGTSTVPTAFQVGTIALNGVINSPTAFRNQADSVTAFQIQNASGSNLLSIDTANSNITLLGNNSGEIQPWQTNSSTGFSGRDGQCAVTANGFYYIIGGGNGSSATNTVQYTKLNSNGSLGNWTTTTAISVGGAQNRSGHSCAISNGFVYVIGGSTAVDGAASSGQSTVYYAKLNADGTVGAWASSTSIPAARTRQSTYVYNGYMYVGGGMSTGNSPQDSVYYAKLNADGTINSAGWSTSTLPVAAGETGSIVVNGYLYIIGGAGITGNSIYYSQLGTSGVPGTWNTASANQPTATSRLSVAAANGYIYYTGGLTTGTTLSRSTYYAKPTSAGDIAGWTTSTQQLPDTDGRGSFGQNMVVTNGYMYVVGGLESGFVGAQTTQYYTALSRVSIGGSLDLVGISGQTLADGGNGGELTAGNTNIIGNLGVRGSASIGQGLSVGDTLTVGGGALFQNSANSITAFQIQNASGTSLLTGDTSNMKVEVNGGLYSKGISWVSRTLPTSGQGWNSVAYGNGLFVAVTDAGTNRIMTSPDGANWTSLAAPQTNNWKSVTYGNGLFVAVSQTGTNRVMTSPDGVNWTVRNAAAANTWNSVTYGNGLFVAVSDDGTNRVMTSPDGVNWTFRSAAAANGWYSVTYGNGLFVAVSYDGTNRVMTSPDGTTWTTQTATADSQWHSVTYGNGLFVAVAVAGTNRVMTSPDGTNWTVRTAAAANNWQSVTYGNGLFVAVADTTGTGNRVMTSPDGTTWTSRTNPIDNDWLGITYGNGTFVAVGYSVGNTGVMTSGQPEMSTVSNNNTYQGGVTVYGSSAFKSDINSTSAFQIQNALGSSTLFSIDTTTSNLVTNPSLEVDTTGWTTTGSGTGLAISRTTTTANVYHGTGALQIVTASSAANSGSSVTGFNSSITPGTYTLSFMARATAGFSTFNVTTTGGGAPSCLTGASLTTGFQFFKCNFTSTTTNVTAINFTTSTSTQRTIYLDAVQLVSGTTAGTYAIGKINLGGVVTSPTVFQNASDSTSAFQIQKADGTPVLAVDTTNGRVCVGCTGAVFGLDVASTARVITTSGSAFGVYDSGQNPFFQVDTSSGGGIITTGTALFKKTSSTAFQIQNADGTNTLFTADTSTLRLVVGTGSTGTTTPTILVLDNKTNSGDPTGVNGAMYYNAATNTFRCYQNGAWVSCIGGLLSSNTAASSAISNTASETNFSLNYSLPANYCVAGRTIRWTAQGVYSTTGAPTLAFAVKAGSTALATSPAITGGSGVTNREWRIEGQTICNAAPGGTAATETHGQVFVYTAAGAASLGELVNTGTTNLATNGALTLQISLTWSAASSSNTATMRQFIIEGMGP